MDESADEQRHNVILDGNNPKGSAVSIMRAFGPLLALATQKHERPEQAAIFWLSMVCGVVGCMVAAIGHDAGRRVLDTAAGVMDATDVGRLH